MTARFIVALDDWPLQSGRLWYSVFDLRTGRKLTPPERQGKTGGWRFGSHLAAQRVADRLNGGGRRRAR